jgi:hypothetical protein
MPLKAAALGLAAASAQIRCKLIYTLLNPFGTSKWIQNVYAVKTAALGLAAASAQIPCKLIYTLWNPFGTSEWIQNVYAIKSCGSPISRSFSPKLLRIAIPIMEPIWNIQELSKCT